MTNTWIIIFCLCIIYSSPPMFPFNDDTNWGWTGPSSAQLEFDFTLISCAFGSSGLYLVELVCWIYSRRLDWIKLVQYIWLITFQTFNLLDLSFLYLVQWILFTIFAWAPMKKLVLIDLVWFNGFGRKVNLNNWVNKTQTVLVSYFDWLNWIRQLCFWQNLTWNGWGITKIVIS